jgi:signal peptidase I
MDGMMKSMVRSLSAAAAATAWLCCLAAATAAQDAAEQLRAMIGDSYEAVLRQVGSEIKRGTKEFDDVIERSVNAVLAARPENCGDDRLLADLCGIRPIFVASGAMLPTIGERDAVLTVPVTAKLPLQRGDIAVFRLVKETEGPEPKPVQMPFRVIGLAGDRVEIRSGVVHVNGSPLPQVATGETMTGTFSTSSVPVLRETNSEGRSYRIARSATPAPVPAFDDRGPVTVPPESYFVLGDNRHNAIDSRLPELLGGSGFVRQDAIVGRVVSVYASPDAARIGQLID